MKPASTIEPGDHLIGPNAAIQLARVLDARDRQATNAIFIDAGLGDWLLRPPNEMIPQGSVIRLHSSLRAQLGSAVAKVVAHEAGRRTGHYILTHRIPRLAAMVLRVLPAPLALPLLLKAIYAHAWTFAGSGQVELGQRRLFIHDNPLAQDRGATEPACDWHTGVFEVLIGSLVAPSAHVRETRCCAMGDKCCTFEIELKPGEVAPG